MRCGSCAARSPARPGPVRSRRCRRSRSRRRPRSWASSGTGSDSWTSTPSAGPWTPSRCGSALSPGDVALVVAVDTFGHPVDYAALHIGVPAAGVPLLADSAAALGSSIDGRPVGTQAIGTCVLDELREGAVRRRRRAEPSWSRPTPTWRDPFGWTRSALMSELHAIVALDQLDVLDDMVTRRNRFAALYADTARRLGLSPPTGSTRHAPQLGALRGADPRWSRRRRPGRVRSSTRGASEPSPTSCRCTSGRRVRPDPFRRPAARCDRTAWVTRSSRCRCPPSSTTRTSTGSASHSKTCWADQPDRFPPIRPIHTGTVRSGARPRPNSCLPMSTRAGSRRPCRLAFEGRPPVGPARSSNSRSRPHDGPPAEQAPHFDFDEARQRPSPRPASAVEQVEIGLLTLGEPFPSS